MTRGATSVNGETRIAQNGYHYTKQSNKWRLTHHIILEAKLGRLVDTTKERVIFVDGDRTNLDPDNIEVRPIKKSSIEEQIVEKESRIAQLQLEIEHLRERLRKS